MNLRHQIGVIMIEVLVSIAVLAFGILGLAALQTYSLQSAKEAYTRAMASDLANDLADRIRTLRQPFIYDQKISNTDTSDQTLAVCMNSDGEAIISSNCPADFATFSKYADQEACEKAEDQDIACSEYFTWQDLVSNTLPAGSAIFCRDSSPADDECSAGVNDPLVIKITWKERGAKKGDANVDRRFYTSFQ